MANPVEVLVKIQKIDLEIDAHSREEEEYAAKVSKAEEELERAIEAKESISAELEALASQKTGIDEKIRLNIEKIEKDQEKLRNVTNDKQLKALNKEVNAATSSNKLLDMELTAVTDKISGFSDDMSKTEGIISDKGAEIESLSAELEAKKAELLGIKKEKEDERAKEVSSIHPSIVKRYDTIRSRRGGQAVVTVNDETCQGCFIQIPPQVYIQIKRGTEEIITCPHCHRILHHAKDEA